MAKSSNNQSKTLASYIYDHYLLIEPQNEKGINAHQFLKKINAATDLTWRNINNQLGLFNGYMGAYETDPQVLQSILQYMEPNASKASIQAVMAALFQETTRLNGQLNEYTGSRYLLFKNAVLDVKENQIIDLNDQKTSQLNFTQKHLLNSKIDLSQHIPDNLNAWVSSYLGPHKNLKNYFLFLLGTNLFPGHNFGFNISWQGPSGSGKSTLGESILNGIYNRPQAVFLNSYEKLNTEFPLNNFQIHTAVTWFKENNRGSQILSNALGVPIYDNFADGQVRIPIKHQNDYILNSPMTLNVDGTQLIQAEDMETGVARRTLPFMLPDDEFLKDQDPWYKKRRQLNIYEISPDNPLRNEKLVSALILKIIQGYQAFIKKCNYDFDYVRIQNVNDLITKGNIKDPVSTWHRSMLSANDTVTSFFYERVVPYVTAKTHYNYVWLYKLYLQFMNEKRRTPMDKSYAVSQEKFIKTLEKEFIKKSVTIKPDGRNITKPNGTTYHYLNVKNPTEIGFDWQYYEKTYVIPTELQLNNAQAIPELFNKNLKTWFKISAPDLKKLQKNI